MKLHPRTKRHLWQLTIPIARLVAGYGLLICFAILAIIFLVIL